MFSTQQYFGFDPRTIPGCSLWMDAADTRTVTGTNPVTNWADKSSNALNFSNFTGTTTLVANARGTLSAINFSGSSSLNNTTFSFPNTSNSIFVVAYQASITPGGQYSRLLNGGGANSDVYLFLGTYAGTGNYATFTGNGTTWNDFNSNTPVSNITGLWTLMEMTVGSTVLTPYLNGTAQNTKTGTTGAFTGLNIGGTYVAGGVPQNVQCWNGQCGEVIVYNSVLSASQRQQVEGYLAWKWGLQANFPTSHPFKRNPTTMRIFQPIDISGCQIWLDAADASTISFATGSNISNWRDKTGNGYNATQSLSGRYPTYDATNRRVNFTRTSNNYFNLPNSALPTGNSAYTYYMMFCFTATQDAMGVIGGGTWGTNNGTFAFRSFNADGNMIMYWFNNDLATGASSYTANTPLLIMTDWNGTTRTIVKNGTQLVTNNPGTARNQGSTSNFIGVTNTISEFMEGYMNEIIVYNRALTSNENRQVEGYLAAKWGLSGSLPSTQPYYLLRALPSTPLFTPTVLSSANLRLWLDGADSTTITTSTGVSQWNDKSGNGYNLTQATGGSQPTQSGNYIVFSNDRYLNIPNAAVNNIGTWSLYFVFTPISSLNWIMFKTRTAAPLFGSMVSMTNYVAASTNTVGTTNALYWKTTQTQAQQGGAATVLTLSTPYVIGITNDGTNIRIYINGTLVLTGGGSTAIPNDASSLYFTMGAYLSPTGVIQNSGSTNFQMGEFTFYNTTLTTDQRQQMEGYLAWKWGLQTSLPTTHPYYKFRC